MIEFGTGEVSIVSSAFWGAAAYGGIVLAILVVTTLLLQVGSPERKPFDSLQTRLGVAGIPLGLFLIVSLLWLAILLILVAGLFGLIWQILWETVPNKGETTSVWEWRFLLVQLTALTTVLGAVVAFPLTLGRLKLTRDQTKTLEEQKEIAVQGHITDRINKAVEGLGASKEVNRLGRNILYTLDGDMHRDFEWKDAPIKLHRGAALDAENTLNWTNVALSEPNLEVRIGAIYALERIAKDSHDDHISVMEILCAYIRHNAPKTGVKPLDQLVTPELAKKSFRKIRNVTTHWLNARGKPRSDIQTALTVLGRRTLVQRELEKSFSANQGPVGFRLDLRGCDLSNAQLDRTHFDYALFEGTLLDGASFKGAELRSAGLRDASLIATEFSGADLSEAYLIDTPLTLARFERATLKRTKLVRVHLDQTNSCKGCDFTGAGLASASLPAQERKAWKHKVFEGKIENRNSSWGYRSLVDAEKTGWRAFEVRWGIWMDRNGYKNVHSRPLLKHHDRRKIIEAT